MENIQGGAMINEDILDIPIRAAKAMGWEQVECLWSDDPEEGFLPDAFQVMDNYVRIDGAIYAPDTDLNQACELGRRFGHVGFYDHPEGGCVAHVWVNTGDGLKTHRANAETPALALTLAALQAAEGGER